MEIKIHELRFVDEAFAVVACCKVVNTRNIYLTEPDFSSQHRGASLANKNSRVSAAGIRLQRSFITHSTALVTNEMNGTQRALRTFWPSFVALSYAFLQLHYLIMRPDDDVLSVVSVLRSNYILQSAPPSIA